MTKAERSMEHSPGLFYGFLDGIAKVAIKAVGNATGLVIKIISFHAEGVRF